jgi:hypothetical protein
MIVPMRLVMGFGNYNNVAGVVGVRASPMSMGTSNVRLTTRVTSCRAENRDDPSEDRAEQRQEDDGGIHPSALHHVDVLDRDRAAIAIEDDEDGEPDRRLRSRHRQHQQREDLAG